MKKSIAVFSMLIVASLAHAQSPKLVKKWESEASLKVPESVYFDEKRKALYVSNIDGEPWGDDKKGSIGKLSLDGKIVAAEWVKGLSAPKGMAVLGNQLYVGDMAEVVVIDIDKGTIAKRISVPGAKGLNDVAAGPGGAIYVSDSMGKKVFAIKDGKPEVHLENLKGPNGLLHHGGTLYVLDGDGAYRVGEDRSLKLVSGGIEGVLDGIEPLSANEFLVSTWQGTVHYVKADGKNELLLDTRADKINAADIGWDAKNRVVYVPTFFKNSVVAYKVE
jgi:DNA-binding beta-propeller fold protein YncE